MKKMMEGLGGFIAGMDWERRGLTLNIDYCHHLHGLILH